MEMKKYVAISLLVFAIFGVCFFLVLNIGQQFIRIVPATKSTVIRCSLAISAIMTIAAVFEILRLRRN
jgi:hypothetical protein